MRHGLTVPDVSFRMLMLLCMPENDPTRPDIATFLCYMLNTWPATWRCGRCGPRQWP